VVLVVLIKRESDLFCSLLSVSKSFVRRVEKLAEGLTSARLSAIKYTSSFADE